MLINLFDRRTAPVCPVKRNVVSGTLAILSGVAIVGSSFLTLLNTTAGNSEGYLLSILVALFSIPAAIAMVMISKVHFTGKTIVSNASMFLFSLHFGAAADLYPNLLPLQRFQFQQAI